MTSRATAELSHCFRYVVLVCTCKKSSAVTSEYDAYTKQNGGAKRINSMPCHSINTNSLQRTFVRKHARLLFAPPHHHVLALQIRFPFVKLVAGRMLGLVFGRALLLFRAAAVLDAVQTTIDDFASFAHLADDRVALQLAHEIDFVEVRPQRVVGDALRVPVVGDDADSAERESFGVALHLKN